LVEELQTSKNHIKSVRDHTRTTYHTITKPTHTRTTYHTITKPTYTRTTYHTITKPAYTRTTYHTTTKPAYTRTTYHTITKPAYLFSKQSRQSSSPNGPNFNSYKVNHSERHTIETYSYYGQVNKPIYPTQTIIVLSDDDSNGDSNGDSNEDSDDFYHATPPLPNPTRNPITAPNRKGKGIDKSDSTKVSSLTHQVAPLLNAFTWDFY